MYLDITDDSEMQKPITSTSHSSFKEVEMVVMLIMAFIIRISIKKVSSGFPMNSWNALKNPIPHAQKKYNIDPISSELSKDRNKINRKKTK